MRRRIDVLLSGVAAALVAVVLLSLVDGSRLLAPMAALGAAIPVSLIYAMLTAEGAEAGEPRDS